MYEFVTVVEFTWPTDAAIPKGLLDAAGIENRLKDELTVQVYNLYSNAIGGVKLQVPPAEFERAREVLREGGFIQEGTSEDLSFWLELDRITKQIPLLGRVEVLIARLLMIVAIVLIVAVAPIVISAQPSLADRMIGSDWCVDRILHNGDDLEVRSTHVGPLHVIYPNCPEWISFQKNGAVLLPGFGSEGQSVSWHIEGEALYFDELMAHVDIYGQPFSVTISNEFLMLRSASTTIHCSRQYWGW